MDDEFPSGDPRVTQVLRAAAGGDPQASRDLLPLVYDQLRRLARSRMRDTPPGNTLQPTALVHEAYLRLIGGQQVDWDGSAHFFGAAAEAMRQILIESVRRKASLKRGGDARRVGMDSDELQFGAEHEDALEIDEALKHLEKEDERKAQIVKLRYFAGLKMEEIAAAMGLSLATIEREWRFARVVLYTRLKDSP